MHLGLAEDMWGKNIPKTKRDVSERSYIGADGTATIASETETGWRRQSSHVSTWWAGDITSGQPGLEAPPLCNPRDKTAQYLLFTAVFGIL